MQYQRVVQAVVAAVGVLLVPAAASAQAERFEAFGGPSFLFGDVGGPFDDDVNGTGFQGQFTFFVNDLIGIGADVGYASGDLDLPVIQIFPTPEIEFGQWTLLFGPRFRIAESERFGVGVQAMAGLARLDLEIEFEDDIIPLWLFPEGFEPLDISDLDLDTADTALALAFGVHFDLQVHDRIVWRVVQPDVLITNYGDDTQTHFRLFSGVGVRF